MANNYSSCTVDPFIPSSLLKPRDIEELELSGFTVQQDSSEERYIYCVEGFSEEDDWIPVFQRILKRAEVGYPQLKEIWVEGASTCSKMRPGEFGGFAYLITANDVKSGATYQLRKFWQNGGDLL
jgi:hypothetical protein